MKSRWAGLLVVAPILVGTVAATAQSMYKWVDEKGRVTYSDQQPPKTAKSQEQVKIVAPVINSAAKDLAKQDTQFRKRQEDAAKKTSEQTKKEQFEAIRLESCGRARGELRAVRENIPIARMTEAGERVVLDNTAREAEGRRLESFLEDSCTNVGG